MASLLAEVAKIDGDHVDDVVLAVSELVTNAIRHAVGEGQLSVRLAIRPRWAHLYVADPDPTLPTPAPAGGDGLALSGRGWTLLRNAGRVLTRMQLIDRVWGADYVGGLRRAECWQAGRPGCWRSLWTMTRMPLGAR